ncbi:uncharacterized protein VICG_00484 [Vittaforma corneae ATCC 50505]|uniref:Uncharacterized protein n=1 Tax=Vittaforma corneae (strain ATCC 50505) TaxID=993615 RepID=L2GPE4_VITCO|nr:uncharacterized protein VICG_00484 [Vittaforma corneae ATCC 50505]ELA42385.1 hypothetical protein VICG_00484 [Vittaforma corneae ATCC 50505]
MQDNLSLDITAPTITIFGNTMDTTPIQVRVGDFIPYLYIQPSVEISVDALQSFILGNFAKAKCLGIEKVYKQSIYGYSDKKSVFYKVYFNNPSSFRSAKAFFENGITLEQKKVKFKIFESNFPYILRFMNDLNLSGMSYLRVRNYKTESTDPFVISTESSFIEQLPFEGEYNKSYTIENFKL